MAVHRLIPGFGYVKESGSRHALIPGVGYVKETVSASSAALTGTITTANEGDIVTGGKTLILTLTGDTWLAAGTGPIGSTANTQAIIDGIDSAQAEATGWDAVVKVGLVPATHVVRTSDTVCTITLPAFATYDITATETITATIPAQAVTLAAEIVASPTFQVTATTAGALIPLLTKNMRGGFNLMHGGYING